LGKAYTYLRMRSSLACFALMFFGVAQVDAAPDAQDRSFLFQNPTLDLLALSTLTPKTPTPAPASNNILPLLALSGAFNGGGGVTYDQYGNPQDPVKQAVLLSGIASGSVSPLTAVAMDRNPGMTSADGVVVSALGNNPLTNLLVLNEPPGQGLVDDGGNLFGNQNGYNQGGIFGGGGVLPALAVASAVGGNSNGLGTLLALDAFGGLNNNNGGFYNSYNGGYNGGYYNGYGDPYNGGYNNGGPFGNIRNNLHNLFG